MEKDFGNHWKKTSEIIGKRLWKSLEKDCGNHWKKTVEITWKGLWKSMEKRLWKSFEKRLWKSLKKDCGNHWKKDSADCLYLQQIVIIHSFWKFTSILYLYFEKCSYQYFMPLIKYILLLLLIRCLSINNTFCVSLVCIVTCTFFECVNFLALDMINVLWSVFLNVCTNAIMFKNFQAIGNKL